MENESRFLGVKREGLKRYSAFEVKLAAREHMRGRRTPGEPVTGGQAAPREGEPECQLSLETSHTNYCAPGEIRTPDPLVPNQVLGKASIAASKATWPVILFLSSLIWSSADSDAARIRSAQLVIE